MKLDWLLEVMSGGIDYHETFASVAKMTTVGFLLSLAAFWWWSLYQMDVKNTFLHRDLKLFI